MTQPHDSDRPQPNGQPSAPVGDDAAPIVWHDDGQPAAAPAWSGPLARGGHPHAPAGMPPAAAPPVAPEAHQPVEPEPEAQQPVEPEPEAQQPVEPEPESPAAEVVAPAAPYAPAPAPVATAPEQPQQPAETSNPLAPEEAHEALPTQVTPAVTQPPAGDEPADEALTIGRGRANSIVLDDMLVSRQHVRITVDDEGLVIEDLGSRNGTFVNGRRVERTHLHEGDRLGIGASTFEVRDGWLVSI